MRYLILLVILCGCKMPPQVKVSAELSRRDVAKIEVCFTPGEVRK